MPDVYVCTLGPVLDTMSLLTVPANERSQRQPVLAPREQESLQKVIADLRRQQLYAVCSTVNAHQYHCDAILTARDLDDMRARGITVHVDRPENADEDETAMT
jgi:hypothetical protein